MELKRSIQVTLSPAMISDLFFNSSLENYNRLDMTGHPMDAGYASDPDVHQALTDDAGDFIGLFCGELDDVTPGELAEDFLPCLGAKV